MARWVVALCVLAACAETEPGSDSDAVATVPWETAECGLDPEHTGWEEGDVLPDFSLMNQHGSQTGLHQFCDRHVLIQVTNFW